MVKKMDIKTLRYFLAVAQEGTITRAAETLRIAQPPLSRQMQLLEEELGVTLFVRGKRSISLTEEGIFLKQQAEEIISLLEKTQNQLGKIKNSTHGTISLGVTETCGASTLPALVDPFHRQYPNIRYNIWCGNGDEVREKLEKGLVDVGLVREPFNTEPYERIFLKKEAWIALMSVNHPLAAVTTDTIELGQLTGEPLIIPSRLRLQTEISHWFDQAAGAQNVLCLYNTLSCLVPLVENNLGIAICPESARYYTNPQKLAYRQITRPEHISSLLMVRRRHLVLTAATNCFWEFVQDLAESGRL